MRRRRLPGRFSLITRNAGRPSGRPAPPLGAVVVAAAALVLAPAASAHAPTTSIGRAVEALQSVSVSYEPGAAVSDVEAGNFSHIVGSDPKVAFLSSQASVELTGGPNAIAEEIAREAGLHGTLIVLVGARLGAWSDRIADDRLAEIVSAARTDGASATPAGIVDSLVRSVQEESADRTPWGWLVALTAVVAIGSLLVLALVSRRSRPARA